jgi:hypothetical protein
MTLIRNLVLALYLVLLCSNYSNAQDLTTGNLVTMYNWTGVTYASDAQVNYCCSGGPNPALNVDTNTLRFSWGFMQAAQSIALNKVFQDVGIKVSGYSYSWKINNSDMTSGPLYGNVSLIGTNGNILESYNYDYSRYIPGFETFSGTQKFSVDYGAPSLRSLDISFTGSDTRFWAGYYGPRVRDVNVSLNYSYDTSKPPAPITLPTVNTNVDTISNTVESTGENSATVGLPAEVIAGTAPDVLATPTTASTSSSPAVVAPVVEVTKDPSSKSSGPSATAMAVVQKNKDAVKAIEAQAVQKAQEQAANDTKSAQQQSQFAIDFTQQATQASVLQLASNTPTTSQVSSVRQITSYQPVQQQQQQSNSTSTQQTFSAQELRQEARLQDAPTVPQQVASSKTDPVKALMEPMLSLDNIPQDSKLEAMKAGSKDSELASGVTIASIAVVPTGYANYTNLQLLDAKFYSDKPIYQNQRVIDNVRVLRGLGSDLKHQQMVQDQYR